MHESDLDIYDAERILRTRMEWDKWIQEIPFLDFPVDWLVKPIPPFGGAVARFHITREPQAMGWVSVYLDCYNMLGATFQPYWEVYPSGDGDAARCYMEETDELELLIQAGLNYQLAEYLGEGEG
jgi:hypothetical protein